MYGFVIPKLGWNLLTKLLAGQQLRLTRIMFGSGRLAEEDDPSRLTDLVQPMAAGTSTTPQYNGRICSFVAEYRSDLNGGLDEGFWINEFGVYAWDPDIGEEILLYYGALGDYPQYIAPYAGGAIDIRRFPVSIVLTDGVSVQIEYPPIALMTAEDVEAYFMATALPFALIEAQKLIDAHNANEDAHPYVYGHLSAFDARISRVEDMMFHNIAGNPFVITFGDLSGLTVTGVWNEEQQRIEF